MIPTPPFLGGVPTESQSACSLAAPLFSDARRAAVEGYMKNRQTLTEKLCALTPYYNVNAQHREWVVAEIKRIDEAVGGLCVSENDQAQRTGTP